MKKTILSIFTLCALSISSNAQSIDWVKIVSGDNVDQVISLSSNSSNLYSTGAYNGITDFDPGTGVSMHTTIGGNDVFIQKLDQNGDLLWVKTIGGIGQDVARIVNDYSTSVIISGTFSETVDFDPGVGIESKTSNGGLDVFILALDNNGDFLWVETFGGPNNETIGGQEINSADDLIITGGFDDHMAVDVNGSSVAVVAENGLDVFFLQMNLATGNIDWINSIGGTGPDAGAGIVVKTNDNFLITGRFRNIMDVDPDGSNFSLSSNGGNSVFLLEYDDQGDFVNGFSFDSNSDMESYDIELDDNENIYLTGYFKATVDFDLKTGVTDISSNGEQDCYIVKLTPTKDLVWIKSFGGTGIDQSFGIEVASNGDVYNVGRYSDVVDFDPGVAVINESSVGSSFGFFILKLNVFGDFELVHTFSSPENDLARGLEIDSDGDMYVSGLAGATTIDFDPSGGVDNLTITGDADGVIFKFSDLVVGLNYFTEQSAIKLHPNPVQNQLFIELESEEVLAINILDISGKVIKSMDRNESKVDVSDLTHGIYILKVYTENGTSTNRFIKQ